MSFSMSCGGRPARFDISPSERRAARVFTQPGQTALTVMPRGPSSFASTRMKPMLACLEAT
jgi:hypothetical protein